MSKSSQTFYGFGPPSRGWHQDTPLDTRLLGQAVIELNIARKNCSIYPSGHVQLSRSIDRAYQALIKVLETVPRVTLGSAKDCLFVGDHSLDQKNPVFKDFALALYSRDMAAIGFSAGLEREEILSLCRVLTLETEAIREAGGIGPLMERTPLQHIQVQPLDYTGLHLTEEKEIPAAGDKEKNRVSVEIWRSFVSRLISHELDAHGQPDYLAKRLKVDPSQIAELLNSGALDLRSALESYEHTIARYLRETTGEQPIENLISLLRDLKPALRSQFLSVTFDHTAGNGDERLLDAFPCDVVVDILQQANEEGKEISPTLISLLEKLSRYEAAQPVKGEDQDFPKMRENTTGPMSREGMHQLFHRESYETYVDEDYKALLRTLITSGNTRGAKGAAPDPVDLNEAPAHDLQRPARFQEVSRNVFASSVEDDELNLRLAKMILALMDRPMDLEDYRGFSGRLIALIPDLIAAGEVGVCMETVEMFRRHAGEMADAFREVAGECLLAFNSSRVAEAAVAALERCPEESLDSAVSFVAQLGSQCISKIVRLYAQEEYPSKQESLLHVLAGFGEEVLGEASKLLEREPEHVVRNVLLLIQRTGSTKTHEEALVRIRALTSHVSRNVRQDALVTMLQLKDPQAAFYLRRALKSIDFRESRQAILLAGNYRVSAVVEDLLQLIVRFPLKKKAFRRNEAIIQSLGSIGDARAIPSLKNLVRRSWSLRPGLFRHMRFILFLSLSGYPGEHIFPLLETGRGCGDPRIRRICENLARSPEVRVETQDGTQGESAFRGATLWIDGAPAEEPMD